MPVPVGFRAGNRVLEVPYRTVMLPAGQLRHRFVPVWRFAVLQESGIIQRIVGIIEIDIILKTGQCCCFPVADPFSRLYILVLPLLHHSTPAYRLLALPRVWYHPWLQVSPPAYTDNCLSSILPSNRGWVSLYNPSSPLTWPQQLPTTTTITTYYYHHYHRLSQHIPHAAAQWQTRVVPLL